MPVTSTEVLPNSMKTCKWRSKMLPEDQLHMRAKHVPAAPGKRLPEIGWHTSGREMEMGRKQRVLSAVVVTTWRPQQMARTTRWEHRSQWNSCSTITHCDLQKSAAMNQMCHVRAFHVQAVISVHNARHFCCFLCLVLRAQSCQWTPVLWKKRGAFKSQ